MKKLKIVLVTLFFPCSMISREPKKHEVLVIKPVVNLTDKSLYQTIVNKGIKYPDIAFSQALLESAHFKSHIYKHNKNLFGMKVSEKRVNVVIGKSHGYAVYPNWVASVEDYKIWQNSLPDRVKKSKLAYYTYLQKQYAASRTYSKELKGIVKCYRNVFSS